MTEFSAFALGMATWVTEPVSRVPSLFSRLSLFRRMK
jgi:hypothetical protein